MFQLPLYQPQVNFNQFSPQDFLKLLIYFGSEIVWILVGLVGLFFVVLSIIFSYHWRKFGIDDLVMGQAAMIYYSVSAVLWVIMIVALMVYLKSL